MEDTERRAYLAGMIDGEGWIGVASNGPRFQLCVQVATTTKDFADYLVELEPRFSVATFRKKNPKHADMHMLLMSGDQAKEFLEEIKPWLYLKAGQAEVALQFPVHSGVGRTRERSDEDKLMQALCYLKLKELNRRGKEKHNGSSD